MSIGPSDDGISLTGTQDFAVKRLGATDIEAQANQGKFLAPISAPATASNTLKGIHEIILLLRDAGFVGGCSTRRSYWIVNKIKCLRRVDRCMRLISLTGEYKNEDLALPAIADAPDRSWKHYYEYEDQAFLAIADAPKGYHTGSSQYVSAESEVESDV